MTKKLSEKLNSKHHIFYHEYKNVIKDLNEVFLFSESLMNVLTIYFAWQVHSYRRYQNLNTVITGEGGAFYKGFYWYQEFPLLNLRKPNIEKLYNMRLAAEKSPDKVLSDAIQDIIPDFHKKRISEIKKLSLDNNLNTIDNIHYRYKTGSKTSLLTSSAMQYLNLYSPLMEYDLFRLCLSLPPGKKMMYRFHRKHCSFFNKELSLFPTTSMGMNSSDSASAQIKDFFKFITLSSKSALNLISRKTMGRRIFKGSYEPPKIYDTVLNSEIFKSSLNFLKEQSVIKKDLKIENFENKHIGPALTLFLLDRYLE